MDERYDTATMDRFAELQQAWHGWGSPVGLGISAISAGTFVLLLAIAWQVVVG